jgi:hypothetical protein
MEEIWKDIPGFKNYKVSSLGNVKSLRRWVGARSGKKKFKKESILKPGVSSTGYKIVVLYDNTKAKTKKIHQLLAESFLNHTPNGFKGLVVDHIDNNKLNNALDNLQIISQRRNTWKSNIKRSSKYTGVSWNKDREKWYVRLWIKDKNIFLGSFDCELKAALSYYNKVKELGL